jgi:hypothetical protein
MISLPAVGVLGSLSLLWSPEGRVSTTLIADSWTRARAMAGWREDGRCMAFGGAPLSPAESAR